MSDNNSNSTWRSGPSRDGAYDPYANPGLFSGVLTRRAIAFLIDLIVISIPVILAVIFIAVFGLVTLGLGWGLFWLVSPATVIWPIVYYGMSLGGPHSATWGMRVMNLQMRTLSGSPGYFVLGCAPLRQVPFELLSDIANPPPHHHRCSTWISPNPRASDRNRYRVEERACSPDENPGPAPRHARFSRIASPLADASADFIRATDQRSCRSFSAAAGAK